MSAGIFVNSKYESNSGRVYFVKVQPETEALILGGTANAAPAGAIDQEVTASARGGERKNGISCRRVALTWTGTIPDGYFPNGRLEVPILTPALFSAVSRGTTGTYLGSPVEVVGKISEAGAGIG